MAESPTRQQAHRGSQTRRASSPRHPLSGASARPSCALPPREPRTFSAGRLPHPEAALPRSPRWRCRQVPRSRCRRTIARQENGSYKPICHWAPSWMNTSTDRGRGVRRRPHLGAERRDDILRQLEHLATVRREDFCPSSIGGEQRPCAMTHALFARHPSGPVRPIAGKEP